MADLENNLIKMRDVDKKNVFWKDGKNILY